LTGDVQAVGPVRASEQTSTLLILLPRVAQGQRREPAVAPTGALILPVNANARLRPVASSEPPADALMVAPIP
jgi:hypothetical protein